MKSIITKIIIREINSTSGIKPLNSRYVHNAKIKIIVIIIIMTIIIIIIIIIREIVA